MWSNYLYTGSILSDERFFAMWSSFSWFQNKNMRRVRIVQFEHQTCFKQTALVRCSLTCFDLTHFKRVILIRNSRGYPANKKNLLAGVQGSCRAKSADHSSFSALLDQPRVEYQMRVTSSTVLRQFRRALLWAPRRLFDNSAVYFLPLVTIVLQYFCQDGPIIFGNSRVVVAVI